MEPDQFQLAADELVDRAENHSEAASPEPQAERQQEPERPTEDNYAQLRQEREGYRRGGMASQQAAAVLTNNRINASYFEHAEGAAEERRSSSENLERRIEQSETGEGSNTAEQTTTNTREAEPAQSQEQGEKTDWQRYTQDPEYRGQVDEQEKRQQEERQATNTMQQRRER